MNADGVRIKSVSHPRFSVADIGYSSLDFVCEIVANHHFEALIGRITCILKPPDTEE